MFQFFNLVPTLSAVENVELPLLLVGRRRREARRSANELLSDLGMPDKHGAAPGQLSGGQQQRVALARALANRPDVVLADEPTGNLDSAAARDVLGLFRAARDRGQTLLLVTHDASVASAADRVITLRDGLVADETQLAAARQVAPLLELRAPGMTGLLLKLAFAGIRSRLLASALTIAIAGAAAAMIVLALEVRSSGLDPWQRTFTRRQRGARACVRPLAGRRARARGACPE